MNLKEAIIEFCKITDVHQVGFTTAKPFYDVEMLLVERKRKGLEPYPFVEADIAKRVYPDLTLKTAKSFIVIIEGYEPSSYEQTDDLVGNISPAAVGEDYHKIIQNKLTELEKFILDIYPDNKIMKFVDNSPFSERHIALRAGLGYIGKNNMFYSEVYGSRCFIGFLLTDIYFGEDNPLKEFTKCNDCNKCISACPTGVLNRKNEFNVADCISFNTQNKNKITDISAESMGNQIYGCDICQSVCPNNTAIPTNNITGKPVKLDYLLNMTSQEFNKSFKGTAVGWVGRKQLQKNAIIALGNSGKIEALNLLEPFATDKRADIKREAKRAIDKINKKQTTE